MHKIDKYFSNSFYRIIDKIGITSSIFIFVLLIILIIFSSIYFITHYNWLYDISNFNEIGDAFGGLSSPFIGVLGVIFTFFAFYVQYTFNKKQSDYYKLDKIDRKINEYALYLDKLCFTEGEINTSIIHLVDRATDLFSNLKIDEKYPFTFEGNSVEEIFLKLVHLNNSFNKDQIKKNQNNIILGGIKIDSLLLDEQTTRKIQVYHKFCKFLELLAVDFENSEIEIDTIQDIIKTFIRKFEICYPMHSFDMSSLFILHYTLLINNEIVVKPVLEYHKSIKNYDNVISILKHSHKVRKK
ncbi:MULTISPECIES: hypothetical protein [unclassified Flavobacterium]|uniref:hypothetical protein n=1 Tax=unclassified Flavobacterium TaxID=196869 RepID=UPI0013D8D867|nr:MULTISPECIES: hypothetical protein [unclassified Flavobacterium]MBA5793941.1 hypothetical protein [Flavobacterium sp. xlx-221]